MNTEQQAYIEMLKEQYPNIDELELRELLIQAKWPEAQVQEGIALYSQRTPSVQEFSTPPLAATSWMEVFKTKKLIISLISMCIVLLSVLAIFLLRSDTEHVLIDLGGHTVDPLLQVNHLPDGSTVRTQGTVEGDINRNGTPDTLWLLVKESADPSGQKKEQSYFAARVDAPSAQVHIQAQTIDVLPGSLISVVDGYIVFDEHPGEYFTGTSTRMTVADGYVTFNEQSGVDPSDKARLSGKRRFSFLNGSLLEMPRADMDSFNMSFSEEKSHDIELDFFPRTVGDFHFEKSGESMLSLGLDDLENVMLHKWTYLYRNSQGERRLVNLFVNNDETREDFKKRIEGAYSKTPPVKFVLEGTSYEYYQDDRGVFITNPITISIPEVSGSDEFVQNIFSYLFTNWNKPPMIVFEWSCYSLGVYHAKEAARIVPDFPGNIEDYSVGTGNIHEFCLQDFCVRTMEMDYKKSDDTAQVSLLVSQIIKGKPDYFGIKFLNNGLNELAEGEPDYLAMEKIASPDFITLNNKPFFKYGPYGVSWYSPVGPTVVLMMSATQNKEGAYEENKGESNLNNPVARYFLNLYPPEKIAQ